MKNTLSNLEASQVFKNGKWIKTENITAVYTNSNNFKYMVSAPKKIFKKAVNRNKIKRLLRNSIFNQLKPNINIVFICTSIEGIDKNMNIIFDKLKYL